MYDDGNSYGEVFFCLDVSGNVSTVASTIAPGAKN